MFYKAKRGIAIALAMTFVLLTFSSCASDSAKGQADIISQKKTADGKLPITILVKHAFSINEFEKAAEEKFPELDIIQIGNYTSDRGIVEYERRLEHGDLADIVMTWPMSVGKEYWEERLLDLSDLPFTNNYHISMLNSISENGKLYYLPGPAQVRGIVYNKTLFEEKGWEVPSDFNGFIELCKKIENSGMRSIQLGFGNSEVLDTAFVGYSYGDCFSKPQDAEWLKQYNNGVGTIGGQLDTALNTFQTMIDAGIWKKSDLDVHYLAREEMFFTRQCAMIEDSVLMARKGYTLTGTKDEFAIMPFFSPESATDWARLYMVCYIGVDKRLAEPENKEKYDMVMKLLEYISTPVGQEMLAADTGAMYSSVNNVSPPNIKEIEKLIPALNGGRYAIFPELARSQSALREGLAGMVAGTHTKDDVIKMVDEQNKAPIVVKNDNEIGKATEDFSLIETGSFIADIMREKTQADFALFLDNGMDGRCNEIGLSAKIYEGAQTEADIMRLCPTFEFGDKNVLQKITLTGDDLINTLEHSVTIGNGISGWFYYFSGLKMEYSITAEPGKRIKKITDSNGNEIVADKVYSVAILPGFVSSEYIKSTEETGIDMVTALHDTIIQNGKISPNKDGRFIVVE